MHLAVSVAPQMMLESSLGKYSKTSLQAHARDLPFTGVFDGHGQHGRAAAEFAAEQLPRQLMHDRRLTGRSTSRQLKARRFPAVRCQDGDESVAL